MHVLLNDIISKKNTADNYIVDDERLIWRIYSFPSIFRYLDFC